MDQVCSGPEFGAYRNVTTIDLMNVDHVGAIRIITKDPSQMDRQAEQIRHGHPKLADKMHIRTAVLNWQSRALQLLD